MAAAFALKPAYDWFYPYYRDRALCLALGATALRNAAARRGRGDDPSSGGRQMPSHWSYPAPHIVTGPRPRARRFCSPWDAPRRAAILPAIRRHSQKSTGDYRDLKMWSFQGDEITYVSLGEGASSEGEFWEALNTAANRRLPCCLWWRTMNTRFRSRSRPRCRGATSRGWSAGFPNFHFEEVDGTDPVASYPAFVRAAAHCRVRQWARICACACDPALFPFPFG